MDPRLLLVKIVTLLYKESLLKDASTQSANLIQQVIGTIKFPETGMDFDRSRESLQSLRATALWMAGNPPDHIYDRAALLQRIRVNVGDDVDLYYAVEQGIVDTEELDQLKRQCVETRRELKQCMDEIQIKEIAKRLYQRTHFNPDVKLNIRTLVREINEQLEPFSTTGAIAKVEGSVDGVDLADFNGLTSLIARAQAETSNQGILKCGWQGINRMTGDHEGFRRGEFIVVGALQHNFKTGFTLNLFKQFALYNTPWLKDPKKKPCLVHISTENDLTQNILWLYANLKENETGVECDLSYFHCDDPVEKERREAEAARYVHEHMTRNGYHIKMYRWDPSKATFDSFTDQMQQLEDEGYEVHAVVCDYLNMFSKRGCTDGPAGFLTRDLFRRVRNYTSPRGILFITPHQLSTEAKALTRQGIEDFVKEIANKGYYDSCRTIDQEVDMELYVHIVKLNGQSYLTVQRGKHRKVKITPDRDLYCVLPFNPVGGILDDYGKPDTTRRKVGGGAVGSGQEETWF